MSTSKVHESQYVPERTAGADRLRSKRVLLVGLGNIGSYLAPLLAPHVASIRLVDRDTVESHNTANQMYDPEHLGQPKVDVTADRVKRLAPNLPVDRRVCDIEDLPWGDFADVDIGLAGLDSLRARQIFSERLNSLAIPYIDGAVGDPILVRVQVLLPQQACLQCSWGPAHYRSLAAEYPCRPGGVASPRTLAPGCAGAATAALMLAQCLRLVSDCPPRDSYEINGDLLAGRLVTSRRRRSDQCRADHQRIPPVVRIDAPFAGATITDLLASVRREFGKRQDARLEFRRGILDGDLFGECRFASVEQLHAIRDRRLEEFGLTRRDHVVVRSSGPWRTAHIGFHSTSENLS